MSGPAPSGGAQITVSSSNSEVASVPSSVTIAAGFTSGTFTVSTSLVLSSTDVTISGSYNGTTQQAALTVNRCCSRHPCSSRSDTKHWMNVKPGRESRPDGLLPDATNLVVDLVCTNGTHLKETVRAQNVRAGGAGVATEKIWRPGEGALLSTHETEEPVPVRVVYCQRLERGSFAVGFELLDTGEGRLKPH